MRDHTIKRSRAGHRPKDNGRAPSASPQSRARARTWVLTSALVSLAVASTGCRDTQAPVPAIESRSAALSRPAASPLADGTFFWRKLTPSPTPTAGFFVQIADLSNGSFLLFDGAVRQTWEWNGSTWIDHTPALLDATNTPAPPIPYDWWQSQAFAGEAPGAALLTFGDQTWRWTASAGWTQLSPAVSPPSNFYNARLACHPEQGTCLMYGGALVAGGLATDQHDTWLWDGASWSKAAVSPHPAQTRYYAIVSQPGGYLLSGGVSGSGVTSAYSSETWRWTDATSAWEKASSAEVFGKRLGSARRPSGEILSYGGDNNGGVLTALRVWTGQTSAGWQALEPIAGAPTPPGGEAALGAHGDDVYLFIGSPVQVWTLEAARKITLTALSAPSSGTLSCGAGLAYLGEQRTCTAIASPGYRLTGFTCSGSTPCPTLAEASRAVFSITVTDDVSITYEFAPIQYTVTLVDPPNPGDVGSVTCAPMVVSEGDDVVCTVVRGANPSYGLAGVNCVGTTACVSIETGTSSFVIADIRSDIVVAPVFSLINQYVIRIVPTTLGYITCAENPIDPGGSTTCTVVPATGHRLADLACTPSTPGCPIAPIDDVQSFVLGPVNSNLTLLPSFAPKQLSVTPVTTTGGSIDCGPAPVMVSYGLGVVCAVTPQAGHELVGVTCGSAICPPSAKGLTAFNVSLVTTDTLVTPLFAPQQFSITVIKSSQPALTGAVTCDKDWAAYDESTLCTVLPGSGAYGLTAVNCTGTDDCASVSAGMSSFTISNIRSPISIAPVFALPTEHTIRIVPSSEGTVICDDNPVVSGGGSRCEVSANAGRELTRFVCIPTNSGCPTRDFASVSIVSLENLTEDITLVPTFTALRYTITVADQDSHGALNCALTSLAHGESTSCDIVPEPGYALSGLACTDGALSIPCPQQGLPFLSKLTLAGITGDVTITPSFERKQHEITAIKVGGGSGSFTCPSTVLHGESLTCSWSAVAPAEPRALDCKGVSCPMIAGLPTTFTIAEVNSDALLILTLDLPEAGCADDASCAPSGYCDLPNALCKPKLPTPQGRCDRGEQCESGLCDLTTELCQDCAGDAQCAPESYCDGGTCQPKQPLNEPCENDGACQSGLCDPAAHACACPEGWHDGGDGRCVERVACEPGSHDAGNGHCVKRGECTSGFRLDGVTGRCVQDPACPQGQKPDGVGACAPEDANCSAGAHDGGDGRCVPVELCSAGYSLDEHGDCVLEYRCLPGYHSDGGTPPRCIQEVGCSPGYQDDGTGRCVPVATPAPCAEGYHDGGSGHCIPNELCDEGFHADDDGDCAPDTACAPGKHDDGEGHCVSLEECAPGYHDGGNQICIADEVKAASPVCSSDLDCGPLAACVEGRCVEGGTVRGAQGCSASGEGTLPGDLGLIGLGLALLALNRKKSLRTLAVGMGLFAIAFGQPAIASAQSSEGARFDVQRFRPSFGRNDLLGIQSALTPGHLEWSLGGTVNVASRPLVFDRAGGGERALVERQWAMDLGLSIGLFDWAELSVALPLTLGLAPGAAAPGVDPSSVALPGLRLTPKARLFKAGDFHVGLAAPIGIPFKGGDYQQSASVSVNPEFVVDYVGSIRLAANGGAIFREKTEFMGMTVGKAFTYGLGAEIPLYSSDSKAGPHRIDLLGTLEGEAGLDQSRVNEMPMEGLAALRWTTPLDLAVTLGAGRALIEGYGAPDLRVLAGLNYAPRVKAAPTPVAPAPLPPEPELAVEDVSLAIAHEPTLIPLLSKVHHARGAAHVAGVTGSENAEVVILPDGSVRYTPKPGFQGDDAFTYTVADAEGRTANGTVHLSVKAPPPPPPVDTDEDGITDDIDKCPNEPETYNGFQDDDGCPDTAPSAAKKNDEKARLVGSKIVIFEQLHFATAKDRILPKSAPVLKAVAKILADNPQIERIRIDGHTDDTGTKDANLDLSMRRAASVRARLVELGIEAGRIESEGHGHTQPIASNNTAKGRALNRRVTFTVTQWTGE